MRVTTNVWCCALFLDLLPEDIRNDDATTAATTSMRNIMIFNFAKKGSIALTINFLNRISWDTANFILLLFFISTTIPVARSSVLLWFTQYLNLLTMLFVCWAGDDGRASVVAERYQEAPTRGCLVRCFVWWSSRLQKLMGRTDKARVNPSF